MSSTLFPGSPPHPTTGVGGVSEQQLCGCWLGLNHNIGQGRITSKMPGCDHPEEWDVID